MATFTTIFGEDVMTSAIAENAETVGTATLPWGVDVDLKRAFFDEVATFDPMDGIASHDRPLLVASGALDTTVLPEEGEDYIANHPGERTLWSAEMDHVFNIFAETETLDLMIADTVAFLDKNL